MHNEDKQTPFEKIFLTVAGLLLFASLYLLTDDSLILGGSLWNKGAQVGTVVLIQNDVRQKNSDAFAFNPSSQNSPVYEGDSIFTGNSSSAVVKLEDGSEVELGPNTLITFTSLDSKIDIDLRFGDFSGELQDTAQLRIKDETNKRVQIAKGNEAGTTRVEVKRTRSGRSEIKLLEGNASVVGIDGKQAISAETPVLISGPEPLPLPEELSTLNQQLISEPIELTQPKNESLIWTNLEAPIAFEWQTAGVYGGYELEIARDPSFKNVAFRTRSLSKDFRLKRYPAKATLYWRVTAFDEKGDIAATSDPYQLVLDHFINPKVITPTNLATLEVDLDPNSPTRKVEVNWSAPPQADGYLVQLSNRPEFNTVVSEESVRDKRWTSPVLSDGIYHFRVRAAGEAPHLQNSWSDIVSFRLKSRDEIPIADLMSAPDLPTREAEIISEQSTVSPQLKGTVTVTHPARFGNDTGPKKDVPVSWEAIKGAKRYLVEYSNVSDFSKKRAITTSDANTALTLPSAGTYYWRVQAIDEINEPMGQFSEPGTINYWVVGQETLPIIREPANNTNYFRRSDGTALVWLQWSEVKFAVGYEVEVFTEDDYNKARFEKPVYQSEPNDSRFLLRRDLSPGTYAWRVRARMKDGPAQWTQAQKFVVNTPIQ